MKKYLVLDEASLFEKWENKAKWLVDQLNPIPDVVAGLAYMSTVEDGECARE